MEDLVKLRKKLNTFDVTNLVVGSIIGADIYIAAALGAKLVGPFSLIVWILSGLFAAFIALSFSISAQIYPKEGGPYSYTKEALGDLPGFIVGWALFLAEWMSLAVFPEAFSRYFLTLFPLSNLYLKIALKAIFIGIIIVTNIVGVKSAGRFNDLLTIGKLAPLILLMITGVFYIFLNPSNTLSNFHPFFNGDVKSIGSALVLIFWAYAGFELSTLPADEVEEPEKTIPKAIITGMIIVTFFYLVTNFVIIGVVDQQTLASSSAPLVTASSRIFYSITGLSSLGGLILGGGALISIMGADESGTLGTSRLAYALSIDGLFPKIFSKLHDKYETPYLGLVIICGTAFVASVLETLTGLINASVFLLSFVYLFTCISTLILERKKNTIVEMRFKRLIPVLGIISSLLLLTQVRIQQIKISVILLLAGIPVYMFFSPKKELQELKAAYHSRDEVLKRTYEQGNRFLAHLLRHIKIWYDKKRGKEKAWSIHSYLRAR